MNFGRVNMKDTNSEMDVLDKFNISAFCDEWGPEKVIQVYDPQTGMIGILIIFAEGDCIIDCKRKGFSCNALQRESID